MTDLPVVARVAAMEVGVLFRRVVRETVGERVSTRVSGLVVSAVLSAGMALLTLQALSTGRSLGTSFGPGLVATLFTASAAALGMTALIGTHVWSRVTSRERERLAVLPLGRRALSVLAAVPAMVPTAVGLYVALPSVLALVVTTEVGALTVVGALALGVALPLGLAVLWTLPLLVLRPRRELVVIGLVAVSLAALLGHAVQRAPTGPGARSDAGLNPVLWVLTKQEDYSIAEAGLSLLALLTSAAALVGVRHLRSRQAPRTARRRMTAVPTPARVPAAPRVWAGLVRIIWRQSSLVSEIGVAAVLSAVVCLLAGVLLVQDRFTHGYTALLVAAGFAALPLLGLQSALGPTYRLTQMGLRPQDIRLGLVGAGVVFQGASLAPGVAVLLWRGAGLLDLVVFGSLAAVTFGIVLSVGSLLRRITATSLGRSLGVGLAMVPFFLLIRLGVPSWPVLGILAAAVTSSGVLAGTLASTVRRTSVA